MLLLQEVPFVRDDSWKRDAVRAIQTVAKLQSAAAFLEPVREEEVSLGCSMLARYIQACALSCMQACLISLH